jgi:hypothetical protein
MTTSSRLALKNGERNFSFSPMPYASAVSYNVTPSSSARSRVARDSFASEGP